MIGESLTLFDSLIAALHKTADYNSDDTTQPTAVLWPDEKREWEKLVPRLRAILPHFLVFGPYNEADRTGPAIWLRCVLAGKIDAVPLPSGVVPIVYLPGVSRSTLRDAEGCPQELKPIFELQFRGVIWSQVNAKDWTVAAFVQSEKGGLQLTLAKDQGTAASLKRAIEKLADVPIAELKAKSTAGELNGHYFDSLVSDDVIDDLLQWISDAKGVREHWESGRWDTLCNRCRQDYDFDPMRDGEFAAAEQLGIQKKAAWKTVWKRYAALPGRYPGVEALLRKAKPQKKGLFGAIEEFWPQDNEAEEADLRAELLGLPAVSAAEARQKLVALEEKHGERRNWVWARLNRSPFAFAIEHLSALATTTVAPLTGLSLADMVKCYTEFGWKADAAMLDSLSAVTKTTDQEAVLTAVAHVYKPWLRDAAELFQQRASETPLPGRDTPRLGKVPAGTCVLFADGLRYDVGQKLLALLAGRVGEVQPSHHFAALPSVTPTAKPAVSPVAAKITGTSAGDEFRPCVEATGNDLTPDRFRKLLDEAGVQYLPKDDLGDPTGRAWTEFGNLDRTGHDEGCGLARRIPELLATLTQRIEALLQAGWKEVRVVTDHGWLLMPKGLPKTDLPKFLVATRWGRCAVVKPSATVDVPCFPWFWAEDVRVACPPGIDSFIAGQEYNHGGLSLQECVVPQFVIQAGGGATVSAKIESFRWTRLRCKVQVSGTFQGCTIDVRDKPADASTTLLDAPKGISKDGTATVLIKPEKDSQEGAASLLVLLDPSGNVIDKHAVTVGE